MSEVRLFNAPLSMVYERDSSGDEKFLREFNSILPGDEDALGAWLKRAKSRGETKESDQVLLTLVIELHRKIDALSDYIKNEHKQYLPLSESVDIDEIGFTHIKISEDKFKKDENLSSNKKLSKLLETKQVEIEKMSMNTDKKEKANGKGNKTKIKAVVKKAVTKEDKSKSKK